MQLDCAVVEDLLEALETFRKKYKWFAFGILQLWIMWLQNWSQEKHVSFPDNSINSYNRLRNYK